MKNLLDGLYISNESTPNEGRRPAVASFQLSVMEILEEAGIASFLHDDRVNDHRRCISCGSTRGLGRHYKMITKRVLAISMKSSATASIHGVMR
jgi:hypothetical protein